MEQTKASAATWEREPIPALHPFAGARLSVFLRHALLTPNLDSRTRYQRLIAWLAQGARIPFTIAESLRHDRAIRRQALSAPPVFLIGHWRSGTTHLHNLMSRDPQFGFLTFSDTALPLNMLGPIVPIAKRLIDKVLPKTRGYDEVKLDLDEPQEEEMGLGNLQAYGYYGVYHFPCDMDGQRDRSMFFEDLSPKEIRCFRDNYEFLIRKTAYVKQGRRLLFKNPPSTTRMELILSIFPDAKFLHIVRNPWPVFASTCRKFPRLYHAFAWQPSHDTDVPKFVLDTYEKVMKRHLEDRSRLALPESQYAETSYERILASPVDELRRLYQQLEIDWTDEGEGSIRSYVSSIRDYAGNVHCIAPEHAEVIQSRWRFAFEQWGYEMAPPAEIAIK